MNILYDIIKLVIFYFLMMKWGERDKMGQGTRVRKTMKQSGQYNNESIQQYYNVPFITG